MRKAHRLLMLAGLAVALGAHGHVDVPGAMLVSQHVIMHCHALNQISFEAWELGEGGSLIVRMFVITFAFGSSRVCIEMEVETGVVGG